MIEIRIPTSLSYDFEEGKGWMRGENWKNGYEGRIGRIGRMGGGTGTWRDTNERVPEGNGREVG
jgi:hypothetical protein